MTQLAQAVRSFAKVDVHERPDRAGSIAGEDRDISHAPHGSASGTQRFLRPRHWNGPLTSSRMPPCSP